MFARCLVGFKFGYNNVAEVVKTSDIRGVRGTLDEFRYKSLTLRDTHSTMEVTLSLKSEESETIANPFIVQSS